ncbi:MAG: D-TA family PLP-dependent enzyme [Verrucomicrobiales bacterium]|nr:D-TA family PLP-dependent enzyme [Verrucomicrobiales bacterium]
MALAAAAPSAWDPCQATSRSRSRPPSNSPDAPSMDGFTVTDLAQIPSPSLLVFQERVEENLRRMVAMAGGPDRLRPHVKTHKLAPLVRQQLDLGITRFKCATIAEAEMTATVGAPDILLAYPLVGPNVRRFHALVRAFPRTRFSTLIDSPSAIRELGHHDLSQPIDVLVDLDIGQHRTGVTPGPAAVELVHIVQRTTGLRFDGLHAYDGHIHDSDTTARRNACDAAFEPVERLRHDLERAGVAVPRIVAGGTPTFPIHAQRPGIECSPGTCVLWDAGYAAKMPDLDFLTAAVLLSRVVSRPTPTRLCLDLGHKAVASEMPHPRVRLLDLPQATPVGHNEEHLVIETPDAENWPVGSTVLGIPWHICPTVALHSEAWVVKQGRVADRWRIEARARQLSI